MHKAVSGIWEDMHWLQKIGHFKKVCKSRKDGAVHEVEVEVSQEEDKIEVGINSVYLNNKLLLIYCTARDAG